jgi:hypothetical protein
MSALLVGILVSTWASASRADFWSPGTQAWEYNSGPDPKTREGRELIDIFAELPEYSVMSDSLMDSQKFRYFFGLMMTRTYFDRDAVKILFVGQDATHIAEAAKQPGTSGFGARVQSIGNFFGVDQGVATTNAFLSTIKGQYGSFDHPYVEISPDGKPKIRQSSFVDNHLWILANGHESEIRKSRERFWEWMIKNNPKSLRLIILFGGAARDAFAEFLIEHGAKVGTRISAERLTRIRVPETKLTYAGGNNEFPVLVDKNGKDLYAQLVGRELDYEKPEDQAEALKALQNAGEKAVELMAFTSGGLKGSGILNPAQLGGYDLEQVVINGKRTNSLKGLVLSDGTVIQDDIGFTMSAHPSSLSKMTPKDASSALKRSFERLEDLKKKGWKVEPDLDNDGKPLHNHWAEGEEYEYGRADIRAGYFEFGAPDDRRVSRADASRYDTQTIVAGTRDRVKVDTSRLQAAKEALPSEEKDPSDLWSVRPRDAKSSAIFDRGPGADIAKALVTSLDRDLLFKPRPGLGVTDNKGQDITFKTHGIDAYYTKTDPGTGLFGFHRGSFDGARVLILADPHGIDDWITSRALTGARGQYLNGLMNDLGFGEDYLVLKTVPVGMDGASAEDWEVVRQRTEHYRDVAIRIALERGKIEAIFTDGAIAQKEMARVLKSLDVKNIPVFEISRSSSDPSAGIVEAGMKAVDRLGLASATKISGVMKDIPRSHLTWWSRIWEGTSGDRVLDVLGKHRGGVRVLVAPNWVVNQKVKSRPQVLESIRLLKGELESQGLRLGKEPLSRFLNRHHLDGRIRIPAIDDNVISLPAAAGF